jgi:hypothetical protein
VHGTIHKSAIRKKNSKRQATNFLQDQISDFQGGLFCQIFINFEEQVPEIPYFR